MFVNLDPPETIPVRTDEMFDERKLHSYLRGKLEGSDLPLRVTQFSGGAANLTYLLRFGDVSEYVLRRPPLGPLAKSSHDMSREYRVLSVLHTAFPYAPRAYLYCDDPSIIGGPFFVMERKQGLVIRAKFPDSYKQDPGLPRRICESLIDRLVELHRVNYKSLGLDNLGHPEGFVERQVEGWYKRWLAAKTDDSKRMDELYGWLKENLPSESQFTIVHNDYKLDNVMFDYKEPTKIIGIFDWDMCTLGDPYSDLGAIMAYWYQESDPPLVRPLATMPTDVPGFMTRQELVRRYEDVNGRRVKDIRFYYVLGLFRVIIIVQQIYIRYLRGQTKDQRFSSLGKMVQGLIDRAHIEMTERTQKSHDSGSYTKE